MSWSAALVDYAKQKPESVKKEVYIAHDDNFLTIQDLYPKAKFHWLILRERDKILSVQFMLLARLPFKLDTGKGKQKQDDNSEGDIANDTVKIAGNLLDSLSALSKARHRVVFLQALKETSTNIRELMQQRMLQDFGRIWPINIGFHAVESMKHVHVHVISSDLLNFQEHYNSFRPDHGQARNSLRETLTLSGFFLHLDDVLAHAEAGTLNKYLPSPAQAEKLLRADLVFEKTTFATIPKLKEQLEKSFSKEQKQPKRKAEDDSQAEPSKKAHVAEA